MSVEEIQTGIAKLTPDERNQISAFLYHLRRRDDPEHQAMLEARMNDRNPANWLTVDKFMRRLDEKADADEAVCGLHAPGVARCHPGEGQGTPRN